VSTKLAELKSALAAAAAADSQFPAGRFEGRGIVICAGGARLFTCAWVCIALLRGKLVEYPPDLLQILIGTGRDIVHPHCVQEYGAQTFDLNAWREHGQVHMDVLRGGANLVRLDSVGGTVLLVRADLHRDGLIFPPFPYGGENPAIRRPHPLGPQIRGELETEGLGIMAIDMGCQCWGNA
jgi:hypothetical protein